MMKFQPGTYLAFVLSKKSRAELLRAFPPAFSRVICHHVTIDFNPTQEKLDVLEPFLTKFNNFNRNIDVYGIACEDGVQCVGISFDGIKARADGSFYHITLSVEPPHKPVESNKLKDKLKLAQRVRIDGTFELLDR